MELNYTLTEQEMVAAMKLHGLGSKAIRIVIVLVSLLLLIMTVFTHYRLPLLMLIGGTVGYLVSYFLVIPYSAKKQFKELKSIQSEIRLLIEDDRFQTETSTGNSNLAWGHLKKWKHNNKIILLYITSRMFYMIPKRAIANEEQLEYILGVLSQNIGKSA